LLFVLLLSIAKASSDLGGNSYNFIEILILEQLVIILGTNFPTVY